ncbi:Transposase, partial [Peptostreptococcus russellii]
VNLKSLKKRIHYVINSIKYSYTNAVVEGKNNMIKVFKRVSFGFRSYRNMRARILLRERFEIK